MLKQSLSFKQIDVFTKVPFKGNPVAVVLDGDYLTTKQMQSIANWTNLSETTFVCKPKNPDADYRLRIFTPQNELPFAGHPTIGSAYAILKHGLKPKHSDYLLQECDSGLVKIYRKDNNELFLTMPHPHNDNLSSEFIDQIAKVLGIDVDDVKLAQNINVGADWYTLQIRDSRQVLEINPDLNRLGQIIPKGVTGITIFGKKPKSSSTNFEVRSFAPNEGADEDPVCGSGNGCVAVLVKEQHLITQNQYLVSQGKCLGRDGRVRIKFTDDGKILVGGFAVACIEGQMNVSNS